jgi:hypothetical protein
MLLKRKIRCSCCSHRLNLHVWGCASVGQRSSGREGPGALLQQEQVSSSRVAPRKRVGWLMFGCPWAASQQLGLCPSSSRPGWSVQGSVWAVCVTHAVMMIDECSVSWRHRTLALD